MGSIKTWNLSSPFLEGVASAFDLFGFSGISLKDIKKSNNERIKRNTIENDLSLVARDIKKAIGQYL